MRATVLFGSIHFLSVTVFAQTLNFSTNPNTPSFCINEQIQFTNLSSGYANYEWDFCSGDLLNTPTNSAVGTTSGGETRAVRTVNDDGQWYSFVLSKTANRFFRYNFGVSLTNTPTVDDLGNLNGTLNQASGFKILKEGSTWYGLIHNGGDGTLLKLTFMNGLNSTPTVTVVANGAGGQYSGMDVSADGDSLVVIVANYFSKNFISINFGSSINNVPSAFLTSPAYQDFVDVTVVRKFNQWFGFALSWDDKKLYRLDFGNSGKDLFSVPSIAPLYQFTSRQSRIQYVEEGGEFLLFVASESGSVLRFKLDGSVSGAVKAVDDLGNFGTLSNNWGLSVNEENGRWYGLVLGLNGALSRLTFPENCGTNTSITLAQSPIESFNKSGTYLMSLRGFSTLGYEEEITSKITISSKVTPDLDVDIGTNRCVNGNSDMTVFSTGSWTNYNWSFGDGTQSTSAAPTHMYNTAGTYSVLLVANATNGCLNTTQKTIQIFNPPQSNFSLPSANPFCTNQNYIFTNTSTSDAGSNPTWQWNVNGTDVSTTQDLTYLFGSNADQTIMLTASIPGCSTQSTQTISSIQNGPLLNFTSPSSSCVGTNVNFTNTSTGSVLGYNWTFGDGNSSTQTSPLNLYATNGAYNVTLSANNAAGCQNSYSKTISIYANPQPDFFIDLPPFSCAGSPSQFNDNTPALTDSNLSGWSWQFGDASNGTSKQRNPAYTYATAGDYNVSLQVTSNFGCSGSIQKTVTIAASPQAAFSNSPACIDQVTQFTDASQGSIASWQWKIQSTTVSTQNTSYTFKSASTFPVTLTAKGTNGCVSSTTKNIIVPVVPTVDFSVVYPCTGTATQFQDQSSGTSDPGVSWSWDFTTSTISGNPMTYTYAAAGSYTVTLTTTRLSQCAYSVSKSVSVVDGPIASFNVSSASGPAPLNVNFTNMSTFADHYSWSFGDSNNSTSSVASPTFEFNQIGPYTVSLTADNAFGCSSTATKVIEVAVPTALSNEDVITSPYPNPTTSEFALDCISSSAQEVHVVVFKLNGHIVFDQTYSAPIGLTRFTVPAASWASGLYMIHITAPNSKKIYRVAVIN